MSPMNAAKKTDSATLEKILSNPDTRAEWVKFQLALAGSSTSAIGRDTGYTSQAVGMVIRGRFKSAVVESAIAAAIKYPAAKIWPERYGEDYPKLSETARN